MERVPQNVTHPREARRGSRQANQQQQAGPSQPPPQFPSNQQLPPLRIGSPLWSEPASPAESELGSPLWSEPASPTGSEPEMMDVEMFTRQDRVSASLACLESILEEQRVTFTEQELTLRGQLTHINQLTQRARTLEKEMKMEYRSVKEKFKPPITNLIVKEAIRKFKEIQKDRLSVGLAAYSVEIGVEVKIEQMSWPRRCLRSLQQRLQMYRQQQPIEQVARMDEIEGNLAIALSLKRHTIANAESIQHHEEQIAEGVRNLPELEKLHKQQLRKIKIIQKETQQSNNTEDG